MKAVSISSIVAAGLAATVALAQAPAPAGSGGGAAAGGGAAGGGGRGAAVGGGGAAGAAGAAGGGRGGGGGRAAPAGPPLPPGVLLALPPGPGGAIQTGQSPGYRASPAGDDLKRAWYEDAWAVVDNLPNSAPAKPKKARRVLVLNHASGYVHSVIPLTALAVTELGKKTGAWSTDTIYDLKDFTAANLANYDVLVLDNTTGSFLDDRNNQAGTDARRAALLDFVRKGKGLVLTHAAGDSYHGGGGAPSWPEFNHMVGGSFKFHWTYPQEVTVKIDDPKSPINAAFGGQEFVVHDEIYTFRQDENNNRKNFHVLTSIDYGKMSAEDKAKESNPRTDGDYVLSWVRKEGQGRVFYQVLGHSEHVLYMQNILKQLTAGIQYAAGDLAVNDSPSAK